MSTEDALEQARIEVEARGEASEWQAEKEAKELDEADEESLYRNARSRVQVKATVDVEYSDDMRVGSPGVETNHISPRHLDILSRNKIPESAIAKLSPNDAAELCRKIIARHKAGLCTYRQAKLLQKHGYARSETDRMPKTEAKSAIDAIVANGWKRPVAEVA